MKKLIFFDLDGTLALIDHRRHFVEQSHHHSALTQEANEKFNVTYGASVINMGYDNDYLERLSQASNYIKNQKRKDWKPDWDQFFDLCHLDTANFPVIEFYNKMIRDPNYSVIILSGRSEVVRDKTETWLSKHTLFVNSRDRLVMRADKDYTPDDVLKEGWLKNIAGESANVFFTVDDRQKVVDMWRRNGITCFQVAPGNF